MGVYLLLKLCAQLKEMGGVVLPTVSPLVVQTPSFQEDPNLQIEDPALVKFGHGGVTPGLGCAVLPSSDSIVYPSISSPTCVPGTAVYSFCWAL